MHSLSSSLLIYSFEGAIQGLGNHKKYALSAAGQKFLSIAWVASIFTKSIKGQEQHNLETGLHRILVCILHVYWQSPHGGWVALWHLLSHPHTPRSSGCLSCKSVMVRGCWWKHCFTVNKRGPGVLVRTAICSHFPQRTSREYSRVITWLPPLYLELIFWIKAKTIMCPALIAVYNGKNYMVLLECNLHTRITCDSRIDNKVPSACQQMTADSLFI